ncbi:recombinase XerC [Pradoshia eiseniae]|uniref:Recombinase XerC n=1 Tax=Pradoshia eiseniae TaxID=2064768 RepID=A0A2S7MXV7_9BACI|nr:tyrosine recombinase XerC [Pradoshia eiseniae]PQD94568.1 recombinase XerC [Pradoshia eiseniae]
MQGKQPKLLRDFLIYLTTIKGKSMRTRKEYEYDLTLFFRFLKITYEGLEIEKINEVSIHDLSIETIRDISLEDMYLFIEYCETVRHNNASARARKVATLKSFFKYLKGKRRLITDNPAEELESPKLSKKNPIYMNLEEAQLFLAGIERNHHYYRNYCMMMFFLNLGLRVSELCSLTMKSIQGNALLISGKGDKERTVYLNKACRDTLADYMKHERIKLQGPIDADYLFLSQKGTKLSRQQVARIVKKINEQSGLKKDKLTPHKLRHTSATIMYKSGADIRSLQQILGHSNISTTQIYTHIEDKEIEKVINNNPFNH